MMQAMEEFLSTFSSEATQSTYRMAIGLFLESVYGEDASDRDALADRYIKERNGAPREVEDDIRNYVLQMTKSDLAPLTISTRLTGVKSFLRDFRIETHEGFWRTLKRRMLKNPRPATREKIPTTEELRRLISHMPLRAKALFGFMAAAGTRIGESLALKIDDLLLDLVPPRARLRSETTKNRQQRIVFFTREVEEWLSEWLKVRERYIGGKKGGSKDLNDPRVFPFTGSNARYIWTLALKKSGLDERDATTDRYRLHPHNLRKRFRTQLASVIPVDAIEALMGHAGYLTNAYRQFTEQELASFYLEGRQVLLLTVSRNALSEIQSMKSERAELQSRVAKLENQLQRLQLEKVTLEAKLNAERLEALEKPQ